jgi:hypothetical protein
MKADNVSFRLGEIEHLPVADSTVDVILSNCVINLSPDKKACGGTRFGFFDLEVDWRSPMWWPLPKSPNP